MGTPLGDVGEFALIDHLAKAWQTARERWRATSPYPNTEGAGGSLHGLGESCLRLGIGDDAAAIEVPQGKTLLTTTDMLVEGVHFLWSASRARVLGRKALAANISDIAAMGGVPAWAFLSIGVPPLTEVEDVEKIYAGMGEMAANFGVVLAGGDTVRSEKWVISVTLLGIAYREPLTRKGGQAGDLILVSGSVGDSAAGLHVLLNDVERPYNGLREECEYLLSRHLDPTPRVGEAMALARHGDVTAMIDVSDGVASEIHHICRDSACGACLELARLPVSSQAVKLASATGQDALHWALYGGEDYELLFTAPPPAAPSLISYVKEITGTPVTVIGRLTGAGEGVVAAMQDKQGQIVIPLPTKGYDHFSK
ncbi:MAG: Thiamine-monophosphate kinase [Pelotomaculum sp. PtaU1.Bin035]|nr:MAG: Thiamine-monophosphate kinase [Pelotomaculum sp. PtaU1.Bin035]